MGSPATSPPAVTLNGRHLAGMQSFPPPQARRQVSGDGYAPASSPLLKYRSPIGTPAPPPRRTTHPGCVLCGYVASATAQATSGSTPTSPVNTAIPLPSPVRASTPDLQRAGPSNHGFTAITPIESPTALRPLHLVQQQRETTVAGHRIIYRDDYLTAYPAEGKEALCSNGRHIVIVLNDHLASVYELGPSDIPLLSHIIRIATKLLLATLSDTETEQGALTAKDVNVGFVNGLPRDPRFPYPHLHAHAFLGPFDKNLPGSTLWRRNVVYGTLNWWSVEDLRAEIREETSNNRVKSGYEDRIDSPIDHVPDAGAVDGLPNALDPDAYAANEDSLDYVKVKAKGKMYQPQQPSLLRTDSNQTVRPKDNANANVGARDYGPDNSSISSNEER